jgi:hypothetical protein
MRVLHVLREETQAKNPELKFFIDECRRIWYRRVN